MNKKVIKSFIDYLKNVKGYSNNTLVGYTNDISQFISYLEGSESIVDFNISHLLIRAWIMTLVENGLTSKSINRKISSLRSFFKYLKRNELIVKNPMQKILALKIAKKLPSYVDLPRIDEILDDKLLSEKNFIAEREKIVISLLYHTGIRRSELIGIKISDIDVRGKLLKVLGKGNKERLIPLNDSIIQDVQGYLDVLKDKFDADLKFLILTEKGQPAYPKLIYNIVNKVLKKYNASEKASPHVLRHTFATHLVGEGAELNAVKDLLGHSSLAATQVYTHNSIERLKEVYDKAHPKAN